MTQQLEQDLRELFADAAARLQIQPVPERRPSARRRFIVPALAAGLAAALVAGAFVAVNELRVGGSDKSQPADQLVTPEAQRLLAALDRTWAGPVRVESTITSGDIQSAEQTTSRSVTEVDVDRGLGVRHADDGPTYMAVGAQFFWRVQGAEQLAYALPETAEWIELPTFGQGATDVLLGMDNLYTAAMLRDQLARHRATVTASGPDEFLVDQRMSVSADAAPGQVREVHLTLRLSSDGRVGRVVMTYEFGADSNMRSTTVSRLSAMTVPVTAERPDPSTVVDAKDVTTATQPSQPTETSIPARPCKSEELNPQTTQGDESTDMPRGFAPYESELCTSFHGSVELSEDARSGRR
jgi:hypothetical protein